MGNQVVVAIRHDAANMPEFKSIHHMGLHDSERVTKKFETHDGIIVSMYHHASDGVCLMINNKGMTNIPCYLDLYKDDSGKTPLQKMIKGYRDYRYSSVLKDHKSQNSAMNTGEKVSIFGYLTDQTSEMPENSFLIMKNVIEKLRKIENGQILNCGWEDQLSWKEEVSRTPIVCLGTIDADQTALVEMKHNLFNITALPFAEMEQLDLTLENEKDKIFDFDKKMLSTFGYKIEK